MIVLKDHSILTPTTVQAEADTEAVMTPEECLRALALTRAAAEEDHEAMGLLLSEPVTPGLALSLAAIASSVLEHEHGREGALARIDGWLRLAFAENPS